jgi:heat shock protein HslJ
MRYTTKIIAIAAATTLLVAACGSSSQDDMETLEGQWNIASYLSETGSLVQPVADTHPDLVIERGSISGTTGCNNLSGMVTVGDDGSFAAGPLMSTLMGCPPPLATQERQIHVSLETATAWTRDGDTATLSGPDGDTMELTLADTSLADTEWSITAINNGTGGVQSVVAGSNPSLRFHDNQTVEGTSGCNSFGGEYTSDGPDLSFASLFSTEMACQSPEGVMEQETNLYGALDNVATYTIRGAVLRMHDADGAIQVTAVRVDKTP